MSKTIKLENSIYHRLEEVRKKRETFSEAVDRLLGVYETLMSVKTTLGPSHYLNEKPGGDKKI